MSAGEQQQDHHQAGQQAGGGTGTAGRAPHDSPGLAPDLSPDLSFERLLQQLQAEESKPASGTVGPQGGSPGVTPVAAVPPRAGVRQQLEDLVEDQVREQAFGPDAFGASLQGFTGLGARAFDSPAVDAGLQPATAGGPATGAFAPAAAARPVPPPVPPQVVSQQAEKSVQSAAGPSAPASRLPSFPAPAPDPDETRGPVPAAFAAPARVATPTQQEPAGEFTRVFTQLPTPRSAPPAILVAPPQPPASPPPGEFTQFFQAIAPSNAGPEAAGLSEPAQPLHAPARPQAELSAPTQAFVAAGSTAQGQATGQATGPTAPASSPAAALSSSPHRDQPVPPAKADPSPAGLSFRQPEPPPGPGEFTSLFQAAGTAPAVNPEAVFSPATSPSPQDAFPTSFAAPAGRQPATAGFTELMQSLGSDAAQAPATLHPGHAALGLSPARPYPDYPQAFSPSTAPAPQAFSPRSFESSPAPAAQSFSPPQQAPANAARPGEFTELMQSLQMPKAAPASQPAPAAPTPAPQAPFFESGASLASAGPSEFTRIIQGSAARSREVPVASFAPAPQASGGAAIGLPIAAPQVPKPPAPPAAEAKTKLQQMMPWLLAANGLLLLLLIVLAVLFLRHR